MQNGSFGMVSVKELAAALHTCCEEMECLLLCDRRQAEQVGHRGSHSVVEAIKAQSLY